MNAKVNSKKAKEGRYSSVLHHAFYLLPCLVGGILMGLTTAPASVWPLAWIALVPLWVAIVEESKNLKGKRQNQEKKFFFLPFTFLLLPLMWGIGYHGLALFWITGIHPMTWMGVPWLASIAIALFCWTFITLWGAALVTVWGVAMAVLNSKLRRDESRLYKTENLPPTATLTTLKTLSRVLIGVALWCALESFWSLGSLWWTSLSYTQSPHNLAILHLGQISGPSTITAAIVAVNGLIAEAWINRKKEANSPLPSSASSAPLRFVPHKTYLAIATGLLISLHLIGFTLYSQPLNHSPETALKVGIIQGNIPNEIKLYPDGWRRAIEGYTQGYETLAASGVDAVLTPETALPFYIDEIKRRSLYSAILEKKVVAWVGAFGEDGRSITNSLFTITGTGDIFSRYSKVKLVPLGEYIPFEEFFGGFIDRLSPLDAHIVAGSPTQLFDTPFGRAIVGICYESAFAQHFQRQAAAGGQFIITASNNAHYSKEMPAQHHAQDVMRAIETDRWAARATNTGYSGIVDPHGRTIWVSGINSYEVHADTIYRRQTQTLYVRWGDWLTPVLLIAGAIALVISTKFASTKAPN